MEISLRTTSYGAVLTIETDHGKLTEDLANFPSTNDWVIPEAMIQKFITIANDMSRFNKTEDLEFVKSIADAFLNDSERKELIDYLTL